MRFLKELSIQRLPKEFPGRPHRPSLFNSRTKNPKGALPQLQEKARKPMYIKDYLEDNSACGFRLMEWTPNKIHGPQRF